MTRGRQPPYDGQMSNPKDGSGPQPKPSELMDVYGEVCAQLRATDEISLKLLTAVPVVTGIGVSLLAKTPNQDTSQGVRSALGFFAAVVTFAIYRWERKNIATCSHLRRWAQVIERDHVGLPLPTADPGDPTTHPHGPVSAPRAFGRQWGKTQAEILLYWTAILSWVGVGIYSLL
jgi:hypothetical protein